MTKFIDKVNNLSRNTVISMIVSSSSIFALCNFLNNNFKIDKNTKNLKRLSYYNFGAGSIHLVAGIFMFFYKKNTNLTEFLEIDRSKKFYNLIIEEDETKNGKKEITFDYNIDYENNIYKENNTKRIRGDRLDSWMLRLERNRKHIYPFIISVKQICGAFSLITALFHFIIGNSGLNGIDGFYYKMLDKNMQILRWIEYSITYTMMMIGLSNISGIYNLEKILLITISSVILNIYGIIGDYFSKECKNKLFGLTMSAGFSLFFTKIVIIYSNSINLIKYFANRLDTYEVNDNEEASYAFKHNERHYNDYIKPIGPIIGVILTLYNLFPAIQISNFFNKKNNYMTELLFISSSLISKLSLNYGIYQLANRWNVSGDLDLFDKYDIFHQHEKKEDNSPPS